MSLIDRIATAPSAYGVEFFDTAAQARRSQAAPTRRGHLNHWRIIEVPCDGRFPRPFALAPAGTISRAVANA